jgi:hypothetical protein
VFAPSAMAQDLGGIDVVPTKGNATTPMSVVTERGCAEPAERVSAVLTGEGLPEKGQVVLTPSELLFSTTRPMELPLSDAFVVYAQRNATPLTGTYTLSVRCTDRIGVNVLDTFSTTMTWKTPSGSLANVDKATYVAKSTAGVVPKTPAAQGDATSNGGTADSASPSERGAGDETDSPAEGSSGPTGTGSDAPIAPGPGEQPLANDEGPDGSNPESVVGVEDLASSSAPDQGTPLITWLLLGASAIALLVAGGLFARGRGSAG